VSTPVGYPEGVIGLDATLKARLVTDVSSKLDTALLTGDGASNTIKGIINQTGVQTDVLDVADADSLLDAIALASAAEVTPNRWFVNGADFISLRKLKETAGSAKYLIESDVTAGPTYRLFGVPVTVTNKLPVGKAVLADTSQIAVARDLAPRRSAPERPLRLVASRRCLRRGASQGRQDGGRPRHQHQLRCRAAGQCRQGNYSAAKAGIAALTVVPRPSRAATASP
jgi:hypothetical protein